VRQGTSYQPLCPVAPSRQGRANPVLQELELRIRHVQERNGQPADAVFTNARGQALSRDGVQYILTKQVIKAREKSQTSAIPTRFTKPPAA
jgi:site-specific recombinase XerD